MCFFDDSFQQDCWCARFWVLLPPLSPPSLGLRLRVVGAGLFATCLVVAGSSAFG